MKKNQKNCNKKQVIKKGIYAKILIVSLFAIAMAFLESAVVIYLRRIYYPLGFNFPIAYSPDILLFNIEWFREFFTLVMIACIGILAGKKFYEKLAYAVYAFALWDIFYYVWLKLILNWPQSFFTLDILLLIPLPWVAPVLAPIICSVTMIIFALLLIKKQKLSTAQWVLLISGSLIIFYTFLHDYASLIIKNNFLNDFFSLATNREFLKLVYAYIPIKYNWILFWIGELLCTIAITMFFWKKK